MTTRFLRLAATSAAVATAFLLTAFTMPRAAADIVVPGADGTDGALHITTDTTIDLSQAVTGTWDQDNSANAGKGVYDPTKWAVVFKYTSVTIDAGKNLYFANHPSRAPVVWLVTGTVTVNGQIILDGYMGVVPPAMAEPGPGGFRGGSGHLGGGVGSGPGLGVGGANSYPAGNYGYSGSYGTQGSGGPAAYGNPAVLPLVGGSAGGGDGNDPAGGGGGGGAMLIAAQSAITISGTIRANGGAGGVPHGGGGSGGAFRLVAGQLTGNGQVRAMGGTGYSGSGGVGRIRLERVTSSGTLNVAPDPSVITLEAGATALVWPPANAPSVRIVSIGGGAVPEDPRAGFGAVGADVTIPATATTQVVVETVNVEQLAQVQVRGTPRTSGNFSTVNATVDSVLANDPLTIRWVATLPVQLGYTAVQIKVVRP